MFLSRLLTTPSRGAGSDGGRQTRKLWLLIIPVATMGLGTWQVFRLQWKTKLIADLERRTTDPPIKIPKELECYKELCNNGRECMEYIIIIDLIEVILVQLKCQLLLIND